MAGAEGAVTAPAAAGGLAAYRRRRPVAQWYPRLPSAEYVALVRSVPCPGCGAAVGERCLNSTTGQPLGAEIPGHHARARAAISVHDDTRVPRP